VPGIRFQTIAFGYMTAYKRLQEAYVPVFAAPPDQHSYLDRLATEGIWVAMFETLNWLDALIERDEMKTGGLRPASAR
jgi:hypothetical protein